MVLLYALRQASQNIKGMIEAPLCSLQVVFVQETGHLPEVPAQPAGQRGSYLKVFQKLGSRAAAERFHLSTGFQIQFRVIQDSLPDARGAITPSRIQLGSLTCVERVCGKSCGHTPAVLQTYTGHRHQKLHGQVGADLPGADLHLDRFRKKLHQGQAPGHPTGATIELPRQFL